jgi:hypothetical protein
MHMAEIRYTYTPIATRARARGSRIHELKFRVWGSIPGPYSLWPRGAGRPFTSLQVQPLDSSAEAHRHAAKSSKDLGSHALYTRALTSVLSPWYS